MVKQGTTKHIGFVAQNAGHHLQVNAAYRISRHNFEHFPSDYASEYVFHFQFGSSGPHSYVIMGEAGSSVRTFWNTHATTHHTQAAMSTVHLVLNSQLPSAPNSATNQYGFQGRQHQQFQWAGCTYAWGRVAVSPEAKPGSGGCMSPASPWVYRCVELQTGRWVGEAIPQRAFRKLGYIDVYEPSLQHVLVATGFKVLDSPFKV